MRQVDGREFHGWAPMRESLEDRVRRVELDEQRRVTAWAVVFTLSACVVAAAVIAIIVMLAQLS
jgi:succinate dehydrogenase hydrophobic anchor subunit